MKNILIILLATGFVNTFSQLPSFQWVKAVGGSSVTNSSAIAIDQFGNVVTCGNFYGSTDFDPGPSSYSLSCLGGSDLFIYKLDVNGNFVWARKIGGPGYEYAQSVDIDINGNVYVVGVFGNTVDFDPGLAVYNLTSSSTTPSAYWNAFILKLDANGNFVWVKKLESYVFSGGEGIHLDGAGNIFVVGGFQSSMDLDPGPGSMWVGASSSQDSYIIKLDNAGNYLWGRNVGCTIGRAFDVDVSGNFYCTGYFDFTRDFDPGPGTFTLTSAGNNDPFVLKLDNNGNFVWAKSFPGNGWDAGSSIKVDAGGNLFSFGQFENTVDFDPGPAINSLTSAGSHDVYISKLDNNGNFISAKSFGGPSADYSSSMTMDALTNLYCLGTFQNTSDFDPGPGTYTMSSAGNGDPFMVKLNSAGNFVWAVQISGNLSDSGTEVELDGSNNIYTCGHFNSTVVDFDPGTTTYTLGASTDFGFVQKISLGPNTIEESDSNLSVKVYPNPSTGLYYIHLNNFSNVFVTDVFGTIILSQKLERGNQIIDLKNGPAGIYFIRIENKDGSGKVKIIKE